MFCITSTRAARSELLPEATGKPELYLEFQASLGYLVKPMKKIKVKKVIESEGIYRTPSSRLMHYGSFMKRKMEAGGTESLFQEIRKPPKFEDRNE